ncbi:MAG: DUF3017 domain-containing protein [Corynebacterium sp.]|nr:DUF3017 domain-containing protein [Corynebacterium sp.]
MIGVFVAGALASAVLSALEHWRRATVMLGAALLWLVLVRLTCDSARVGVFAVRSRKFDSVFSGFLGLLLIVLSISVDSLGS